MKPTDLRPLPDHYIALGPILKTYGTMGDFIVDSFPETALDDYIFIEIEGIKVPFEIEELVDRSGQVVVKVSGVDDVETAELYRGCPTFVAPSDQLVHKEESALKHLLMKEHAPSSLGRGHQHHADEVR